MSSPHPVRATRQLRSRGASASDPQLQTRRNFADILLTSSLVGQQFIRPLPGLGLFALGFVGGCGNNCEDTFTCSRAGFEAIPADAGPSASGAGASGGASVASPSASSPSAAVPPAPSPSASGGSGAESLDAGRDDTIVSQSGADGGTAPPLPPCEGLALPHEDACVLGLLQALHVSPLGSPNGAGTQADPVGSLSRAVALLAVTGANRLLLCHGAFPSAPEVRGPGAALDEASADSVRLPDYPVRINGGFDCSNWSYAPEAGLTRIQSTGGEPALRVAGAQGLLVADLSFETADAAAAGESSIAASVSDSSDVTLLRVTLSAGNGADAAAPPAFTPAALPACTDLDCLELAGNPAAPTFGGEAKLTECPSGDSSQGGPGGSPPTGPGGDGLPALGAGLGGSGTDCGLGGAGMNGAPGADGPHGAAAAEIGGIAGLRWRPSAGGSGLNGGTGQGGGGGAGSPTGGGGGGGAGGCGGAGAPGGLGGGASIALLSVNSGLALPDSVLISANGGAGSSGVPGQLGNERGGDGGLPDPAGCQGGRGGRGGNGGHGAGGTGGSSLGVVFLGIAPDITEATVVLGGPGQPGAAGGPEGAPGQLGLSLELLAAD